MSRASDRDYMCLFYRRLWKECKKLLGEHGVTFDKICAGGHVTV
jgi:hypothetical protein